MAYGRVRAYGPLMPHTADDLADLLASWLLHLRAERKSVETVNSYEQGVKQFVAWAVANGRPLVLDRSTVDEFMVSLIDAGREAATLVARQLAVRRFSAWLAEEGEIATDRLIGLKAPKVDAKPLRPLTSEQLKALFAACKGTTFLDKRDEALARFMAETMARAGDTLSMTVADTNVKGGQAIVIGKGRKPRLVAFGPQTGVALDRYLRARRTHRLAESDRFWLGGMGKSFGYDALYHALTTRAVTAGVEGFHPHQLRRTGATRWLLAKGSESGLQAAAGWTSLRMVQRYTDYTRQTRAAEEARGLNLGDL